jgi:hypothetical protein
MIISDRHKFAFVHIPKCAGTSVRKALRPIDAMNSAFDMIGRHPEMGMVNYAHVTLADLSRYFPEEYRKVAEYRSVAIVRDPVDRFFSAIFQRLREFKGYDQSRITAGVIDSEVAAVVDTLSSTAGRLGLEYVHFNRQSDYVFNGGNRIVTEVFALDRLVDAAQYIESCTGVRLDEKTPENRTVALRAGVLAPIIRSLRKPYAAVVPLKMRNGLRTRLTNFGLYGNVDKRQFLEPGSRAERFLNEHYAQDFDLYAAATLR